MKKIFLSVLIFLAIDTYCQRILDENVAATVYRLPLKPLGKDLKAYAFTVSTPYPENNSSLKDFAQKKYNDELANYPKVVEESKLEYEDKLKQHDDDVKEAKAKFKIENDAFEKMTLVERLAMKDQKPVLRLPSKPTYYKPSEPRYVEPDLTRAIVYDSKMLANSYLKLDGYQKGDENALKGKITLYNFEHLDPIQKTREVSYFDKNTGQTLKKTEYYHETSYKRAAELVLEFNGKMLYNGIFEGSGDFKVLTENNSPNLQNLEKKTVTDLLTEINEFINSNYGYSPVQMKFNVSFVKNKNEEYDDLEKAKNYAISGYAANKQGVVNEDLVEAIAIWKKAIAEANPDDKKARIDEKVLRAILINSIEAALVINDMKTAETCIKDYEALKNSNSERTLIKALNLRYEDANTRFLANK